MHALKFILFKKSGLKVFEQNVKRGEPLDNKPVLNRFISAQDKNSIGSFTDFDQKNSLGYHIKY